MGRGGMEVLGNLAGVVPAYVVIVWNDDDVLPIEEIGEVIRPFPSAARVTGGDKTTLAERLDILLALDHENPVWRVEQAWQSVGHSFGLRVALPNPVASAIGPPLTKPLRV